MKLTKNKLCNILKPHLHKMGYIWFKDSYITDGCFCKLVDSNLYLSLCLNISRYSSSLFTADYYISTTNTIACIYGDIPKGCYKRIGFLLTDDELKLYFPKEYSLGYKPKDVWWSGFVVNEISNFIQIIQLTESRITTDTALLQEILNSKTISNLQIRSKVTKDIFRQENFLDNLEYTPSKEIDNIPINWFKAAETSLKKFNIKCNKQMVINLASTSYREYTLEHKS